MMLKLSSKEFVDLPPRFLGDQTQLLERLDERRRAAQAAKKAKQVLFELPHDPEFKGDYLGDKIPSLLEFLENKIHMREVAG